MKKHVKLWTVIALVALGLVVSGAAIAAEKQAMPMQNLDPKSMATMMNSPQMQQQCVEYMKSPEMQKAMISTMKQPEMQAAMKQMLQQDAGFHQMMLDLVNSVDMNMDHGNGATNSQPSDNSSAGFDHASHHRQ